MTLNNLSFTTLVDADYDSMMGAVNDLIIAAKGAARNDLLSIEGKQAGAAAVAQKMQPRISEAVEKLNRRFAEEKATLEKARQAPPLKAEQAALAGYHLTILTRHIDGKPLAAQLATLTTALETGDKMVARVVADLTPTLAPQNQLDTHKVTALSQQARLLAFNIDDKAIDEKLSQLGRDFVQAGKRLTILQNDLAAIRYNPQTGQVETPSTEAERLKKEFRIS